MENRSLTPNVLFRQVLENRGHGTLREIWSDFLSYLRARDFLNLEPFMAADLIETAEIYLSQGVLDRLHDEEDDMEAAWFADLNRHPGLGASTYAFLNDRNLTRFIDKPTHRL